MPRSKAEVQVSKSPAEFFAENQAIAGFDNLGKSLYTTIRELVENALDACESIQVLPKISVQIEEMTLEEFNVVRGLSSREKKKDTTSDNNNNSDESFSNTTTERKDLGLFQKKQNKKQSKSPNQPEASSSNDSKADKGKSSKKKQKKSLPEAYFRIKVRDNGCGMAHDAIPNLLGRVLSGSKYGVRQTRGKFGLGAKMALIWSKKSTGVPIRVVSSHNPHGEEEERYGKVISTCVLDIDIYKNQPRIIEHKKRPNKEQWVGTEFEVLIAGNWTTYKARIVQYLQQLAIITPYATLELEYTNMADGKKNMTIRYDKRSEQMPPPAQQVKHHPLGVNNLLISQLLERTGCKTLHKFLCTDLSSISPALAKRLLAELGSDFDESMKPSSLSDKQITRLVQLLRSVELFRPPDGSCLSPLGEYNLNLGIRKVLEPDVVATARDKPSAYDGHSFLVEAAISLGGKGVKEGITVVRFANRIPLLFEGGADVATRVAQSKIKWSSYKIDMKRDKIGVFVSIVSTKIPFKGTGKEYIGDDITEIQQSVKRALQGCCQQLRAHLTKKHAMKDIRERKSRLAKYVPDVGRALFGLLDGMRQRHLLLEEEEDSGGPTRKRSEQQQQHDENNNNDRDKIIAMLDQKKLTEASIQRCLMEKIERQDGTKDDANGMVASPRSGLKRKREVPQPLFFVSLHNMTCKDHDIHHPLFTFRPIKPIVGGGTKRPKVSE